MLNTTRLPLRMLAFGYARRDRQEQVQACGGNRTGLASGPQRPMAANLPIFEGWYAISEANRIFGFDRQIGKYFADIFTKLVNLFFSK